MCHLIPNDDSSWMKAIARPERTIAPFVGLSHAGRTKRRLDLLHNRLRRKDDTRTQKRTKEMKQEQQEIKPVVRPFGGRPFEGTIRWSPSRTRVRLPSGRARW
jgi:hypothetical protein